MILKVNRNIVLESLNLSHSKAIFETIDKHREELCTWLPFVDFTRDERDTVDFIQYDTHSKNQTFSVFYKGKFAGLCGLKDVDKNNWKAEIGYWISPEFQNKGIATLSGKMLLKYGFQELKLNRIQIRIGVKNVKSIRVAEKLAFRFEGIERDGELLSTGFHDINVYSLLNKEYAGN